MKRCLECGRTYVDDGLQFCLYDGKPLQEASAPPPPRQPAPTPSAQTSVPGADEPTQVLPVYQPPAPVAAPAQPPVEPAAATVPVAAATPKKSGGSFWPMLIAVCVVLMGIGYVGSVSLRGLKQGNTPSPGAATPSVSTLPAMPSLEPTPDEPITSATPPPESSPEPSATPGNAMAWQEELKEAVRRADDAETRAVAEADTAPLREYYTGDALQQIEQHIQQLRDNGQRMEQTLKNQDFKAFTMSADGQQAEVTVVETWDGTVYDASHNVVQEFNDKVIPQQITLQRKSEGGWIVQKIQTSAF